MLESETTSPDAVAKVPPKNGKHRLYSLLRFLAVMSVMYFGFCFWLSYDQRSWIRDPQWKTVRDMKQLARRLSEYREKNGTFPDRLEKLFAGLDYSKEEIEHESADGWGRPLNYETDGKTWRLSSYGSDGQPGGIGVETDIHSDDTLYVKRGMFDARSPFDVCVTALPALKQIFVKSFFERFFIGYIFFLVYWAVALFFTCYFIVSKNQESYSRLEVFGWWFVASPFILWFNYMIAIFTIIPSAQK